MEGIDHIALSVSDIERSLEFYCGLLGFKLLRRLDCGADSKLGEVVGLPRCQAEVAHLYMNDLDYALKYVRGIEAGMAHVNIHSGYKTPELPFGGWKESGFGPPENGRSGLVFFVQSKSVYMRGI